MTVKKARVTQEKNQAKVPNPFEFFGEVKGEFHKITWTSQEELKAYTKVVVVCTFLFGLGIYTADLVIQSTLFALNWLMGGGI